ncbi:MAG: hypothetical protein LC772_06780 [Chloroflexi bacterium]|nr:hypothetical protein [Chloroflexota bacterium]
MKWLRLHTEAGTDAKLESLTDAQHRVWFRLLCAAGEAETRRGAIPIRADRVMAVLYSRGDVDLLKSTLATLQDLEILKPEGEEWRFVNWERRQYDKPTDSPEAVNARVAALRERRKLADCNADVTPCNADVTPCNAPIKIQIQNQTHKELGTSPSPPTGDARTDLAAPVSEPEPTSPEKPTATKPKAPPAAPDGFEELWDAYPRHDAKAKAQQAWRKLAPSEHLRERILERVRLLCTMPDWTDHRYSHDGRDCVPYLATWLNGRRWEDELPPGRQPRPPGRPPATPAGDCSTPAIPAPVYRRNPDGTYSGGPGITGIPGYLAADFKRLDEIQAKQARGEVVEVFDPRKLLDNAPFRIPGRRYPDVAHDPAGHDPAGHPSPGYPGTTAGPAGGVVSAGVDDAPA